VLGRHDQIPLVLAVGIIDYDYHLALPQVLNDALDGIKCGFHRLPINVSGGSPTASNKTAIRITHEREEVNAEGPATKEEHDFEPLDPGGAKRSIRLFDLSNAVEVPSASEISGEPEADNLQRQFRRNRALTEREDVRVVVLARPAGGVEAPTKRATDAFDFVGDNGLAVAGTAQHDAALELSARHRLGDRPNKYGVIHGLGIERAKITHFVSEFLQQNFDLCLVIKPGVIRADGDFHGF